MKIIRTSLVPDIFGKNIEPERGILHEYYQEKIDRCVNEEKFGKEEWDEIVSDCKDKAKREVFDELNDYYEQANDVVNRKLPIFRKMIVADTGRFIRDVIKGNGIGKHWSWKMETARAYDSYQKGESVLIRAIVPSRDTIDFEETLNNNFAQQGVENEITLKASSNIWIESINDVMVKKIGKV